MILSALHLVFFLILVPEGGIERFKIDIKSTINRLSYLTRYVVHQRNQMKSLVFNCLLYDMKKKQDGG